MELAEAYAKMRALIPLKLQGVSEWAVRDMFNWPLKALVDTDQFWLVGAFLESSLMTQPVLAIFFNPWFHDAIWAYLCTQCFWGQSDDGLDQFGRGTRHDQAFTSRIVDHFQHGIDRANSFFRRPASWSAFLFYCKAAHGIPHSTSGGRLHASHAGRTEKDGTFILCIDTVP